MAKRRYELPGIQELSKEQETTRALPSEGQHLIIGGPGTGKSVLALIRTRRHQRERDEYLFLVFNHLLDRASGQLFGDDLAKQDVDRMVSGNVRGRSWVNPFPEWSRTTGDSGKSTGRA